MRDLTTPYNLRQGEAKSTDELTPWEMSQMSKWRQLNENPTMFDTIDDEYSSFDWWEE